MQTKKIKKKIIVFIVIVLMFVINLAMLINAFELLSTEDKKEKLGLPAEGEPDFADLGELTDIGEIDFGIGVTVDTPIPFAADVELELYSVRLDEPVTIENEEFGAGQRVMVVYFEDEGEGTSYYLPVERQPGRNDGPDTALEGDLGIAARYTTVDVYEIETEEKDGAVEIIKTIAKDSSGEDLTGIPMTDFKEEVDKHLLEQSKSAIESAEDSGDAITSTAGTETVCSSG